MQSRLVVLLLEADALVRHALAEYIRECGYKVVEAANTEEAFAYLQAGGEQIEVALLDAQGPGAERLFALAQWIRVHKPETDVVMAGALETAAQKASELCKSGPTLSKPYDHAQVVDFIKRLRAARDRQS